MDTGVLAPPSDLPRRKKKKNPSSDGLTSDSSAAGAQRLRRPRRNRRTKRTSSPTSFDLTERSTTIGYAFVLIIISLYGLGCLASIRSLPEVDQPQMTVGGWARIGRAAKRALASRFGRGNLNVARNGLVPEVDLVAAEADLLQEEIKEKAAATAGAGPGEGAGQAMAVPKPARSTADKERPPPKQQHLRGGGGLDKRGSNAKSALAIPEHKWPVSINDEDGKFEDIKHPGDESVTLAVPRFWSPPIHNNKLMTRDQAMSIGSCATPDPQTGSLARGDRCPPSERTVFVAIASYRDWQCRYTVESIFSRAKNPNRVRVAVVDQIAVEEGDFQCEVPIKPCSEDPDQALCKYKGQVDVYRMDAIQAVGPVFARHIGHRLYRGEYYTMQSDAHVTYT